MGRFTKPYKADVLRGIALMVRKGEAPEAILEFVNRYETPTRTLAAIETIVSQIRSGDRDADTGQRTEQYRIQHREQRRSRMAEMYPDRPIKTRRRRKRRSTIATNPTAIVGTSDFGMDNYIDLIFCQSDTKCAVLSCWPGWNL